MREPLWNIDSVVLKGSPRDRLAEVTCSIDSGVTAILGGSGAGKTSLLNLLAGMETPDSGFVQQRFKAVADDLPLYWAPQTGGLWPHLTVHQHLTEVGKDADSADKWLTEFDLTGRRSAFPGELSQGERARLSIARALAIPACVLLFDEPLVHVDGERKTAGWRIIRQTIRETGTHLVLTTHEPDVVLREADSVICLAEGRLAWNGPVQDLYYNPANEIVGRFLGPLNWFDTQDQSRWLSPKDCGDDSLCVRPEQLQLVTGDEDASCEVVRSHFSGSHAETVLRRSDSDELRTIIHRPAAALRTGEPVTLRISRGRAVSDQHHV